MSTKAGELHIRLWHCEACLVYLNMIYFKSERANLAQAEIARIKIACKELSHG